MATIKVNGAPEQFFGSFDGSNNFTFFGPDNRPYTISAADVTAGFTVVDRGLVPGAVLSALRNGTATNAQVQLALAKVIDLIG